MYDENFLLSAGSCTITGTQGSYPQLSLLFIHLSIYCFLMQTESTFKVLGQPVPSARKVHVHLTITNYNISTYLV